MINASMATQHVNQDILIEKTIVVKSCYTLSNFCFLLLHQQRESINGERIVSAGMDRQYF